MTLNPKLVKNLDQVMDKANGSVKLVTGGENKGETHRGSSGARTGATRTRGVQWLRLRLTRVCCCLPGTASVCSRAQNLQN